MGAYTLLLVFPRLFTWLLPLALVQGLQTLAGWLAVVAGPLALYAMNRIYRIKARPFWDHWQVMTSFYGSMLTLGALVVGVVTAAVLTAQGGSFANLLTVLAWPMAAGLALEGIGLIAHARDLTQRGGEGAASHLVQRTSYGNTYRLRNIGLALSLALVIALGVTQLEGVAGLWAWMITAALIVATATIGRALFYVLVIPTTMPGAFFWRNKGFEEHARETGLANMPQVGVLPNVH
jgi:DMSO reductase anchor subunit